jgi:murein DD-endopeptidase MepM/ murein hydrolase activator NlpD
MAVSAPVRRVIFTVNESKKRISQGREGIKNIGQVILKRTKVKREAFAQTNLFRKRREESEKRMMLEDELEAPRVAATPTGAQQLVEKTGAKGFFNRILGFIGYLAAGWLMNNLPTWIAMGKEFIARIQKAGEIVSGFFNNTIKLFTGVGSLLSSLGQNLLQFDFFDTSNRVKNSMSELNNTMGSLTGQIEEAFSLLTTPLTEGKYSGEEIPETGTQQTDQGAYEEPPPYSGSGGGNKPSVGTPEQRAMLDAIAFAEGTRDQPNGGYKTLFGFGQFDDYSRHPDRVVRKGGYASAAAGRYQFMPRTFNRLAKKLGLKDFSPQSQDRAALELAKELGITPEFLKREGMSPKVSALLGRQWASFPGKTIGLDQPTKRLKDIQKAYNISLRAPQQQPQQSQPQSRVQVQGAPMTVTSGFGWRWGRQHQGIDLVPKSGKVPGTPVIIKKGGVVSYANIGRGNMGQILITHDDGTQSRYLHVNNFKVKSGQKVSAGQTIAHLAAMGSPGIGNATGPHLHFEYYSSTKSPPKDPAGVYQNYVSLGGKVIGTPPSPLSPTQSPRQSGISIPEAQIAAAPQQSQTVPSALTPERRGQDIIIVDQPRQQQNIITPAASGGGAAPAPISDFDLLNNFIKNKLLLDLAYL